MKFKGGEI